MHVDYQNKVTVAEGELGNSKAMLAQAVPHEKRYRILLTDGWTTRAIYEEALKSLQTAQAQVKANEANLRIAKDQLSYTQLLAPGRRSYNIGWRRPRPGCGARPDDRPGLPE